MYDLPRRLQTASVGYYTVITAQAFVIVKRYPDSIVDMVNKYSHVAVLSLSLFVGLVPLCMGELSPR